MKGTRILSILTVFGLCLNYIPFTVSAESMIIDPTEPADITEESEETTVSGTCGENLTWTLDDGVLTVSGTGSMTDYYYRYNTPMTDYFTYDYTPWYDYREEITKVVFEEGVKEVGSYAFSQCTALTEVSFPNTVTKVGTEAFSYCNSLTEISFPQNVAYLDYAVLKNCESLEKVFIYNRDCYIANITKGTICNLYNHLVNPVYDDDYDYEDYEPIYETIFNGRIYGYKDSTAYSFTKAVYGESYFFELEPDPELINTPRTCGENLTWTLENGVMTISGTGEMTNYTNGLQRPWNESCLDITKVVIEEGVTSIGENALRGCTNVSEILLPDSMTSIGLCALYGCNALTEICFPESVNEIAGGAMMNCSNLRKVCILNRD